NLVGQPCLKVFPTASTPFVSPGKYGPNFTAKYESRGGDCAAAMDGMSSDVPAATAARTPMTDFDFMMTPSVSSGRGLAFAQGPYNSQGKPSSSSAATCVLTGPSSAARQREQRCRNIRVRVADASKLGFRSGSFLPRRRTCAWGTGSS